MQHIVRILNTDAIYKTSFPKCPAMCNRVFWSEQLQHSRDNVWISDKLVIGVLIGFGMMDTLHQFSDVSL